MFFSLFLITQRLTILWLVLNLRAEGTPHLNTPQTHYSSCSDIMYLREAFQVDKSDEAASEYFTKLIYVALKTKRTQFNEAIHILAHPNKEKEVL